ncbi:LacI family DNA-binding transcriptional regulator [Amycolatopsis benzoatilytica]|uniref:LacI family DNA-binding transcriptional regulator n=1 Tax=Amycolatopsis benzoatilytica TaxID=346045 RepID=UPI00038189FB|nr:LacI family DNA-binding transcriptional regulator [Amycolatopsis benzoatilytica]
MTISAVAAEAGVSTATVSRVLTGQSTRPELAARVREAAEKLDYRPNEAARGLVSGRYHTVGVVAPDLANPYFSRLLKVLTLNAADCGFRTVVADSNDDPGEELELCRSLLRQVDGLVLLSPRMPADALRVLAKEAPGTVMVNRVAVGIGLPTVAVDGFGAMLEVCGHLVQLGHRKVAYLAGPEGAWQDSERRRAVEQAAAFGLEAETVRAGSSIEDGYQAVDAALQTGATALLGFNDLVAVGLLKGLRERGIRVPGDISLAGADDVPFATCVEPALTTTTAAQQELGEAAWRQLQAVLSKQEIAEVPLLTASLVLRDSTGPVAR